MAKITAILVAYNSASVIGEALAALIAAPEVANIIVVDNASRDETRNIVRQQFPQVELIESSENLGFGRGNNIALEKAETDYALLVNPDAVMGQGAIAELLRAAAAYPDAAILAPALYDENVALHHSFKRNVFARDASRDQFTMPEGDCCAEFLSGAVMLWNMKHMRSAGFFDANIFLFYEDDDICLRVRQAGLGLVYVPAARATHLMGKSSGNPNHEAEYFKQKHMVWSQLYLYKKYGKCLNPGKLIMVNWAKYFWYGLCQNRARSARYRGRLDGIRMFCENMPRIGSNRHQP